MIERAAEAIWCGDTLAARASRVVLAPFAALFAAASDARSRWYEAGWLRVQHAPLPVISVGNLRVGGTGKTPTVLWLVDRLRALGARPVVAMRGYGAGRATVPTWIEPDAEGVAVRARDLAAFGFRVVPLDGAEHERGIADEALLVALRGTVAVACTPDRARAAQAAHAAGADVLVLDDGFQHRRLHRDLDIVLTRRAEADENVLPAGPLREPWHALRRADVVMAPETVDVPQGALLALARARPTGWVDRVAAASPLAALESWRGREVVAVAGIARPARFFDMLDDCGVRVRMRRTFRDHHRYTREEWADVCRSARTGEWIVTTEKDLVKLRALAGDDSRLAALRVEMVVEPEVEVLRRLRATLARLDAPVSGPHDRWPLRLRSKKEKQ